MKKTILVTGATDGIGLVTARALAKAGHRVIVHGRNSAKAQRVIQEIRHTTGNPDVDYLVADLFSMTAIQQMAQQFCRHDDHLDVLINNAGAVLDNQWSSGAIKSSNGRLTATILRRMNKPFGIMALCQLLLVICCIGLPNRIVIRQPF
ncbi:MULTISPECIES: SDR family NAD(P)-dependent oxidoreductase [Lactobacillaceae]|uniref:SDR family NAD(P)-dependent oxidoreductase n=1 Tax=Lactobacillaceae TaxID=33958 RepID=UPI0014572AE8|nr:SDR family NAD(P)-dependent oxidoreductase [Lactobacillus sp. HBUAS51381]NLR10585.1 SDR family NAD(P)-dependent oxidoreductase [Lactobacillus sp. HBUAS51381]